MKWIIQIFDCAGQEILEYRKFLEEEMTEEEADKIAAEYEAELYEKDSDIDWYELSNY